MVPAGTLFVVLKYKIKKMQKLPIIDNSIQTANNFTTVSATNISNDESVSETSADGSFKFNVVGKYIRIESADGSPLPVNGKILVMLAKIG